MSGNQQSDEATPVKRLEPSGDVVGQRLGEEIVLVNLQTNRIFELNSTGGRFWELLQSKSDRAEIEEQLRSEFLVPEPDLRAEVDRLIEALAAEDLVRVLERD